MSTVSGTTGVSIQIPQNGSLPAVNQSATLTNAGISGTSVQPYTLTTANTIYSVTPPSWSQAVTIIPDGNASHDIWIGGTVGAGQSAAGSVVCSGAAPFIGPLPIKSGSTLSIGSPSGSVPVTMIWS